MVDPLELSTADPAFDNRQPLLVNGYLFLPLVNTKEPEHQLIDLCRALMKSEAVELTAINFSVTRPDGEFQSYSTSRLRDDEDDDRG